MQTDQTRGVWYAADELETSLAEVTYHKGKRLAEIVVPDLPGNRPHKEVSTNDDWLADFRSMFHMIEPADNYAECLHNQTSSCTPASDAMVVPVLYASVLLWYNPRSSERFEITFKASGEGEGPG